MWHLKYSRVCKTLLKNVLCNPVHTEQSMGPLISNDNLLYLYLQACNHLHCCSLHPLNGFRGFKCTCYLNYQKISCPSVLQNAKILSYYKMFSVRSLFSVGLRCLIQTLNSFILTSFILLMRTAVLIKKRFFSLGQ